MPSFLIISNLEAPLYLVLARIVAWWALADAGYFLVLPVLGFDLSYNTSSIAIALYFLFWSGVIIWYFWDIFASWLEVDTRIWMYVVASLGFASLLGTVLYAFAHIPALAGPIRSPSTDLLFASPWYFVPKATEIIVQQLLITVLVLSLQRQMHTLFDLGVSYAVTFGGLHVAVFLISGTTSVYAITMTTAAVVSALIFPYLITRLKSGFVYSYMIHLSFYVFLAFLLHTWPPPGYGGV